MKRLLRAAAAAVLLLGVTAGAACADGAFPWTVAAVAPLPELDAAFQRTRGWTGGDGAHSLPVRADLTLWLFGDTFYGDVVDGRRIAPVMVHNSAAWRRDGRFEFFPTRGDLLRPRGNGSDWYWPGDAALVRGHLELFCMRVRPVENAPFGFDFEWYASDLLEIDNPRDIPPCWRIVAQRPAPTLGGVALGAACAVDGAWLYAWGLRPTDVGRDLFVARRAVEGGAWQWHCASGWAREGALEAVFGGAAPEMSICAFRGGWLAVYSPSGLSPAVAMRWAPRPEGPWSAERIVHRAPEAEHGLLVYGARAHPELGSGDTLVLSYNCNAPTRARLMDDASAYAPRFIRIRLSH